MGVAYTPPSRDFMRELQLLRRDVEALKRMPSGAASIATTFLAPVPAGRLYRDAAQSIPTTTPTAIEYTQEYFDSWGMHDTTGNRWRVVAPISGWYMCGAVSGLAASAGGSIRELYLQKNLDATFGANRPAESSALPSATVQARLSVNTVVQLTAGDWMSAVINQNSGGALLTENITQIRDEFWMIWLGN